MPLPRPSLPRAPRLAACSGRTRSRPAICLPARPAHRTPPFKRYVASLPNTERRTRAFKAFVPSSAPLLARPVSPLALDPSNAPRRPSPRHALHYLNLYLPRAPVDIGPTPRYTRITHKDELAVFATAAIPRWTVLRDFVAGNTAPVGREKERMPGADSELLHLQQQQQQAALEGAIVQPGAAQAEERARARVEGQARKDFSMVVRPPPSFPTPLSSPCATSRPASLAR